MKTIFRIFTLFLLTISVFGYNQEEGALVLTKADFNSAISEFKFLLVNFYASWCRYSKAFRPTWNEIIGTLNSENHGIKFARVEAYDEKDLAESNKIEGYPTIKFFLSGKEYEFVGERTAFKVIEFAKRKAKAPLHVAENYDWVNDKLDEYEWIGIYNGPSEDILINLAFEHDEILFVKGDHESIKEKFEIKDNTFVLVSNITKSYTVHQGEINSNSIHEFVEKNKFPTLPVFSRGIADELFSGDAPAMILFIKKNQEVGQTSNEYQNATVEFEKANKNLSGKMFMIIAYYDDNDVGFALAEHIGVEDVDLPAVRVILPSSEKIFKWKMVTTIESKNIVDFYQDVLDGKAKRYYLSEPIPPPNNDFVKKIVMKSFQQEVFDSENDVLILFWTPWCGHCRAMLPAYENVGRKTRYVNHFTVGKIDLSKNEVEGFGFEISKYPTILFFPANDRKNFIEFKEDRTEQEFDKFIRTHASVNLSKMKGPNPFDKNEL